ncbi:hypothetical protein TWF694_002909 [Orbilia ellipsospora]|uniref:Uncharacterized protein n=1 Tax=Orbilia ellipsospora TaxID=2528407 RepID=A0AAV9X022_9PEZI
MVLLEIALIVGGVIFFKNRKKRAQERAAREAWYASGRNQYNQPPPPLPYDQVPQSPRHKHPAVYGSNAASPQPQPQPYPPIMAPPNNDPYQRYEGPPPSYASLRPQDAALGYERQDTYGTSGKRR